MTNLFSSKNEAKVLTINFEEFCSIHDDNYAGDPIADKSFRIIGRQANGSNWTVTRVASECVAYCKRTDDIDGLKAMGIHVKRK